MTPASWLRRIGAHRRLEPTVALLLRARQVRESGRFAIRELFSRRGRCAYHLRADGSIVLVRHGTGDIVTLGEIFHRPDYEPPPSVAHALGCPRRIVDLGANVGMFGLWARGRWPGAEISAYEADPANAHVHAEVIRRNEAEDSWHLECVAAGARTGTARFVSGRVALSHLASEGEGDVEVPVRDVLDEVAAADLLKIDIEGGEWAILSDPRFAAGPPRVVVLEYHPRACPAADPRDESLRLLTAAGLQTEVVWSREDGHGLVWGFR